MYCHCCWNSFTDNYTLCLSATLYWSKIAVKHGFEWLILYWINKTQEKVLFSYYSHALYCPSTWSCGGYRTSKNLRDKRSKWYLGQQKTSETHNSGWEQFCRCKYANTWTRLTWTGQRKQLHWPERPDQDVLSDSGLSASTAARANVDAFFYFSTL